MMKKNFLIRSATLLIGFLLPSLIVVAQNYDLNTFAPLDPKYKTGTLPNGMKYYISSNKLPEKRAEFYIIHHVGALQEDDGQNGLAHFTEHMAFNGTQNFPKKQLLNYLETIGVKFGQNVNASTDLGQTIYNISDVPLLREGIIDTALLILHDWSNYISFDSSEVETERGVILEEWRGRNSSGQRMEKQLRPVYYKDSKYAKRDVIGDTAIINHCKHEAMKNFYHKWYRPDLQAMVIVGDFDDALMEKKIIKLFSQIPKVENPAPRIVYPLPDNTEPLIGIATDKEAVTTEVKVYFKHEEIKNEDKNLGYLRITLTQILINNMLQERMSELGRKENPPFINASISYGPFASTKDVYWGYALARNNEPVKALKSLLTEMERMKKFGFTASELERAKINMLRSYEAAYTERDKRKNNQFVWPAVYYFLQNYPASALEYEYGFAKTIIPEIQLSEINQTARKYVRDDNMIISLTGPEKPDINMPNEQDIKTVLSSRKDTAIDAYADKFAGQKLLETEPVAGKVTKTKNNKDLGTTEWTLSNGIRVVLKPTDFKDDQLLLNACSFGGESLLPDMDIPSARFIAVTLNEMGVGNFSPTELSKVMAGKLVGISPWLVDDSQGFNGSMSPKDLETALQLIYLYFTQPRWNETDYNILMDKMKAYYANLENDPNKAYGDSISVMLNNHNKRYRPVNSAWLTEVSFNKIKRIYKDRFKSPGNFTFIFTGKIDVQIAKPLVEKYLASLPSVKNNENFKDDGVYPPKGEVINDFSRENKTPRTSVYICYSGITKYTFKDFLYLSTIRHILDLRYTETIREEKGGSYNVGVSANLREFPVASYSFPIWFDTDPKHADELKAIVFREIKKIVENGPQEADLQKAKEFFLKRRQEEMKENNSWQNILVEYYFHHTNFIAGYEKLVDNLSVKSVHDYAKKVFLQRNSVQVIMRPKE